MRSIAPSTVSLFVVLVGTLAGCGGGGDQANNNPDDGNASGGTSKQDAGTARQDAPERKIALGTVKKIERVGSDKDKLVLRPSAEMQGGKQMAFRVAKNAKIALNGEAVEVADVKPGQQAQIEYVSKDRRDRALVVQLFSGGE